MIHTTAVVETHKIGEGTNVWQFVVVLKGAEIGKNCNVCAHCFIENEVLIGDNVTIKSGVYLWDGITLEANVFVGPNVTFTNDRYPKSKNAAFKLENILVKKGASIGAGSIILPGLEIGESSLIGAGALVTKNVPSRAIVVGSPAKVVGWLDEDGIKMKNEKEFYVDSKGNKWKELNKQLFRI